MVQEQVGLKKDWDLQEFAWWTEYEENCVAKHSNVNYSPEDVLRADSLRRKYETINNRQILISKLSHALQLQELHHSDYNKILKEKTDAKADLHSVIAELANQCAYLGMKNCDCAVCEKVEKFRTDLYPEISAFETKEDAATFVEKIAKQIEAYVHQSTVHIVPIQRSLILSRIINRVFIGHTRMASVFAGERDLQHTMDLYKTMKDKGNGGV